MKKKPTGKDDLRNRIEEIARRRLPDRVLGGILAGREAEIRKDATIMLLKGFLLGKLAFPEAAERGGRSTFHLERGVSIALKHCKDCLKRKVVKVRSC